MKTHFFNENSLSFLSRTFLIHRTPEKGRGRRQAIFLNPLYHFHLLHRRSILDGQLLQRIHFCTSVTAQIELGSFGFRLQVAKH